MIVNEKVDLHLEPSPIEVVGRHFSNQELASVSEGIGPSCTSLCCWKEIPKSGPTFSSFCVREYSRPILEAVNLTSNWMSDVFGMLSYTALTD